MGKGAWTDDKVYVSYYGGTNASPYLSYSGYTTQTSLLFTSIPVTANTDVKMRVAKLQGAPLDAANEVTIWPVAKNISDSVDHGAVFRSTRTREDFAGDQFVLWWNFDGDFPGAAGLALFLNPPYEPPTAR